MAVSFTCPACLHPLHLRGTHSVTLDPSGRPRTIGPAIMCPHCSATYLYRNYRAVTPVPAGVATRATNLAPPAVAPLPPALPGSVPPLPSRTSLSDPAVVSFRHLQALCKSRGIPARGARTDLVAALLRHPDFAP